MNQMPSAGLRARVALDKYGFRSAHALGQNFLLDDVLIGHLLDLAGLGEAGNVLEIGPGAGVMTYLLSERCERVVTVELDEKLRPVLEDVLCPCPNVRVIYENFLKLDLERIVRESFFGEPYRVAANLPYYITSDALLRLIHAESKPDHIAIMVQKEAAERIMSSPGQKSWCALAAYLHYFGRPEVLEEVPAEAFEPAPHVTSCFMTIERYDVPPVVPRDEALFYKVVQSAFAMRRKTLANNLKQSFHITAKQAADVLSIAEVPEKVRGEALELEALCRVSDALGAVLSENSGG